MAHTALANGEVSKLTREDFTVVADDVAGRFALVIPRIAVTLNNEKDCDFFADLILNRIELYELTLGVQ